MDHEVLIVFIDEDGIFLECLFHFNEFVEILFSFKRSVKQYVDLEDSDYRG